MEKLLCHRANPDAADTYGWTACHEAAKNNSVAVLQRLISKRANLNVAAAGQTPVHWAALGGHRDAMELLLTHGAHANVRDAAGDSPWHWAAQNGFRDMLEKLMHYGDNTDAANNLGQTPAMVAREQGHLNVAEWLNQGPVRALIVEDRMAKL